MELNYIIVQAGGKGTRMENLTHNKPKALVPINNLPMIFHLFRKYPSKKFIIIGDYKFEVLKKYLEAFAEVEYKLVCATGHNGTCSGMKKALQYIPEKSSFMITWCDLVLPDEYKIPDKSLNYVGIAKDFPCRWSWDGKNFKEIKSNSQGVAGHFIFENKSFIEDVPEDGEFVRWLETQNIKFQELPLIKTKEYGLKSEYQKLEVEKCRPFNRLIINGDIITKEGIDDQGRKLAVRESAWYEKIQECNFENIPHIYGLNPIRMEKVDGKNIYEYRNIPEERKKDILKQIVECLKSVQKLEGRVADKDSYYEAYIGKTFDRLEKVKKLVPFADKEYVTVNGRKCRNVFFVRNELEQKVMRYMPKEFRLIHGDCTFSNMMLKNDRIPMLIDPRGYFGTTEFYGDPAYDWVKLYYSLVGNYDQFNLKRFSLDIQKESVQLVIDSNNWENLEPYFFELLKDEVTPEQIKLLHAIIWLSLTTYAWQDYDSICGAFYNGLYYMEEAL